MSIVRALLHSSLVSVVLGAGFCLPSARAESDPIVETPAGQGAFTSAPITDPAWTCCLPSGTCVADPAECGAENPVPVSDCLHCIPPGDDCWEMACGRTSYDFDFIPEDFFDPGSNWFAGRAEFRSDPQSGPGVRIRRVEGMALELPGESAQIPIEVVSIDLISCQPIEIMTNGQPQLWDVRLTLSPSTEWPGNEGMMTVRKLGPSGGDFSLELTFWPVFTFTRVAEPHDQRILDADTYGFDTLEWLSLQSPPNTAPWVHEAVVPISTPCPATNFVPGVNGDPQVGCTAAAQCCEETAYIALGLFSIGGILFVPQPVCAPCECGACCQGAVGSCSEVLGTPQESAVAVCANSGGHYMGAGSNCFDTDGDGIPDVQETKALCTWEWAVPGEDDFCDVPTDPWEPDSDGDGRTDGEELMSSIVSPCIAEEGFAPPLAVTTYPHGALKQRYISFAPDELHTNFAYRVKDVGSGTAYFISTPRTTPAAIAGQGLTFLVSDAAPPLNDWTSLEVIHVGGCMIAPGDDTGSGAGRAYEVTVTADGATFTAALTVYTAARPTSANGRFWGDVVGAFSAGGDGGTTPPTPANSWAPPNRSVNGFDISATLQAASSASTAPHFTWTDVNPQPPDRVTIGSDVLRVVNAFSVGSGKEFYPYAYPQAPTPIHGPTPPNPALCPPPPLMSQLNP
ncbi:MAG: hypothetical protein J5J06_01210 [Phycisphaerae bacterium]|nr:hypothetical protein [Phycisphaerae bacterium]